ncbi:unnamed protein product [Acanthoscelides obtectus]|uniref:C2H2-type domain-containing protein n=1 Tax=Acanthoscelides obtectus TaxID=200917 RepID=A0A9P0JZJ3_ACAOB|nr:unnamed protein product [Acanthoscelides obtectus]CAK1669658.1 Zinc finger and BTB domain-containing protein 7A [Acanthoscelides obtectus]
MKVIYIALSTIRIVSSECHPNPPSIWLNYDINGREPEYDCQTCQKRYMTKTGLNMHIKLKCGGKEKTFFCHICSAAYFYKKDLKNHLWRHHGIPKKQDHIDGAKQL